MQAAQKTKRAKPKTRRAKSKVTKLPTARRPQSPPPAKVERYAPERAALAKDMAAKAPTQRPWFVADTIDPLHFGLLTALVINGWRSGTTTRDRYFVEAARIAKRRGLFVVGLGLASREDGTITHVVLFDGGDEHDRAVLALFLRETHAALAKGRPYLRRVQ